MNCKGLEPVSCRQFFLGPVSSISDGSKTPIEKRGLVPLDIKLPDIEIARSIGFIGLGGSNNARFYWDCKIIPFYVIFFRS
ncbi:MAG: hypothetical protein NVS9B7_08380 [Flavisolibacter sp.]